MPIPVTENEMEDLLICTFRYALGRTSYITHSAIRMLRKYHHYLNPSITQLLIKEIEGADAATRLGMETDIRWRELHAELLRSLTRPWEENPYG
jgi:hypothetical protein